MPALKSEIHLEQLPDNGQKTQLYSVKKLVGRTEPSIGKEIGKHEVDGYIRDNKVKVVITGKK